jgi:hypothetical protein
MAIGQIPTNRVPQPTHAAWRRRDPTFTEGIGMYGHSHTGIGALVLTLVAGATWGIRYIVRHGRS